MIAKKGLAVRIPGTHRRRLSVRPRIVPVLLTLGDPYMNIRMGARKWPPLLSGGHSPTSGWRSPREGVRHPVCLRRRQPLRGATVRCRYEGRTPHTHTSEPRQVVSSDYGRAPVAALGSDAVRAASPSPSGPNGRSHLCRIPGERPGLVGGVPALAARETPTQNQPTGIAKSTRPLAPLKDIREFQQAAANPELGVVQWPSGADLEPDVRYAQLSGQPIEIGLQRSVR